MANYTAADFHGCMEAYRQIKAFLKPEDKVYYLGDAGDRGPQSWETLKAILNDEQFIYIRGNHDQMLIDSWTEFNKTGRFDEDCHLHFYNGGKETLMGLLEEENPQNWINMLRKAPVEIKYGEKVHLSHAGMSPWQGMHHFPEDLIWDRQHIYENYEPKEMDDIIIVHGHTVTPLLMDWIGDKKNFVPGAYWYCDNHKVCVDNGTIWTGYTCLLNLDTFEDYVFEVPIEAK